jgi:hypothetical protein
LTSSKEVHNVIGHGDAKGMVETSKYCNKPRETIPRPMWMQLVSDVVPQYTLFFGASQEAVLLKLLLACVSIPCDTSFGRSKETNLLTIFVKRPCRAQRLFNMASVVAFTIRALFISELLSLAEVSTVFMVVKVVLQNSPSFTSLVVLLF